MAPRPLFFALRGQRNDGNKYIEELYAKGVRAFVVDKNTSSKEMVPYDKATFIVVEDTLKALQKIAAYHRKKFNIPIIGITGSNGKTIIKEWLYQILSPELSVIRSPKSYNSQIGVPLSVWQLNDTHQLGIFEAGISRPNEMQKLEEIIRPKIGIFANIGEAHGKNFKNLKEKIEEKLKLFNNVDTLIYCLDHKEIKVAVDKLNVNTFTWSRKNKDADVQVYSIEKNEDETIIKAHSTKFKTNNLKITIPFTDDASIENAIHCWLTALKLNVSEEIIEKKMRHLSPIAMRMELKSGINNCEIINDSYNSDFNALTIALDFMNQQHHRKKRVVILSDILQSELREEELYEKIAQLLKNKGVEYIIGIGEAITRQSEKFNIEKIFYRDVKDFLANHQIENFHNQMILIKGAREFGFEKISKLLQEKAHETILEINLNNLVKNMNYYRSKLNKDTKLMVMVKAFAYGSGNFEVSNVLEFHRADYLTVAYADEGIELRRRGITLPIMVMTPEINTYESIIKNNLEPDIYSFRSLNLLEDAINNLDIPLSSPIGIHIKLDTGMHRAGFEADDLERLCKLLNSQEYVEVRSIFSHLAAADEMSPEMDEFTLQQIALFDRNSTYIKRSLPYGEAILRHTLNTAGIERFSQYQFDMVRLGIGLWGVNCCNEDQLRNVCSFSTRIMQLKEVKAGETVGYSRRGVVDSDKLVALLPLGYADGVDRRLGNGRGAFFVNGQKVPTIGNICMDLTMIDVTGLDVKVGDEVVLFNDKQGLSEIANILGTIPYEVLTSFSSRVRRVYYRE